MKIPHDLFYLFEVDIFVKIVFEVGNLFLKNLPSLMSKVGYPYNDLATIG